MITIRNARAEDASRLTEIGLKAWHKATSTIGETRGMAANAEIAFSNFVTSGWLTITVAEWNGEIAGWAAREQLDENITDFWIDPAFAGKGLGRALLADVEREMQRQGVERAVVISHALNEEAIGFFERHGYHISWMSLSYSPKVDREVDSVGLTKVLMVDQPTGYDRTGRDSF